MSDFWQTVGCCLIAFLMGAVWVAWQNDRVVRAECDKFGFVKLDDAYYNCERRP